MMNDDQLTNQQKTRLKELKEHNKQLRGIEISAEELFKELYNKAREVLNGRAISGTSLTEAMANLCAALFSAQVENGPPEVKADRARLVRKFADAVASGTVAAFEMNNLSQPIDVSKVSI